VQNATDHARNVAAAITGDAAPYGATPWFWTEQGAAKLQIAGMLDGHDELVVRGDPSGGRFSVFAFRAGELLGAESVNRPADHMVVRKLLTARVGLSGAQAADEGFDLKAHAAAAVAAR
jgi:3-phenylpropionate/trans-cinnamate dioxygenase ferredoxin reductase subunit